MEIKTTIDLAKAYRIGPWAWPGGYPLYPIFSDGEMGCWKCFKENHRNIADAVRDPSDATGFRVVALDIHWEGEDSCCGHCSARLPSAYGEEEKS